MKTKIIALMLIACCLLTAFAGCSDKACKHIDENKDSKCDKCEATYCLAHTDSDKNLTCDTCGDTIAQCEAHKDESPLDNACDICKIHMPCAPHKDDDADAYCDICNGAIVVNYEQIASPTDERVAMTVTPIPESVDLGKYITTDMKEPAGLSSLEKFDTPIDYSPNGIALLTSKYDEMKGVTTYSVYDIEDQKVIYSVNTGSDLVDGSKDVSFEFYTYYFRVETTESQYGMGTVNRICEYYTYDGARIVGRSWTPESYLVYADLIAEIAPTSYENGGVAYVTFANKVWAFDPITFECIESGLDKISLVHRPSFDYVCEGQYGYVEENGKIFVYDLNEWINCVYSYDIPDHYVDYAWYVLANGNILMQGEVRLENHAISYDYLVNGSEKYDLVYTVIKPAEKTATAVEFGYYIELITAVPDTNFFTSSTENVAVIKPIFEDVISAKQKVVVLNNDMTIAADITEAIDYTLLADGLFLKKESIGSSEKTTVVDVNGSEKAYVPYDANLAAECIVYDGCLYSFEMKKILDFERESLSVFAEYDNYLLLVGTDDYGDNYYYHYDMLKNKKTEIDTVGYVNIQTYEHAYVVTYASEMGYSFALYNLNGNFVQEFDSNISSITYFGDVCIVSLYDGSYYIGK